jgi:hypothetical protein
LETNLQHEIQELQQKVTPFIFRVVIIFTLVGGILGLLFFLSVLFFQIDGSNFPGYFQYKDENGIVFKVFLILQMAIHTGFIYSAFQLIKNKKAGVYIYSICITLFIISRLYYSESLVFIESLAGLTLLFLMLLSWKKLT